MITRVKPWASAGNDGPDRVALAQNGVAAITTASGPQLLTSRVWRHLRIWDWTIPFGRAVVPEE